MLVPEYIDFSYQLKCRKITVFLCDKILKQYAQKYNFTLKQKQEHLRSTKGSITKIVIKNERYDDSIKRLSNSFKEEKGILFSLSNVKDFICEIQ